MPKAVEPNSIPAARRRRATDEDGALLTAVAIQAVSDPDAALQDAVAALRAADSALALHEPDEPATGREKVFDARTARLGDRRSSVTKPVIGAEPRTAAGLIAKAQATIPPFNREVPASIGSTVEGEAEPHVWVAYRLAHEVLALAGVEPWPEDPARAGVLSPDGHGNGVV